MSTKPAVVADSQVAPTPARWYKNPSYPERTHFSERAALEGKLKACDEKLAAVKRKLGLLGNHAKKAEYERVYNQLCGARDQIADAGYRMAREAGGLYHEDLERLEAAERSFAWILQRWDAITN